MVTCSSLASLRSSSGICFMTPWVMVSAPCPCDVPALLAALLAAPSICWRTACQYPLGSAQLGMQIVLRALAAVLAL
jgi:hypothetical protein